MTFKEAVGLTANLETAWKDGLGALEAQDRPHIKAEDTRQLRGSADVDTALRLRNPNANRWDFAIGYQHTNRDGEFIYWVETHTGRDNQIKDVLKKLEWLKTWLRRDGQHLDKFDRDIIWVSSGHTFFTKGSAQVKMLAQRGLLYSGAVLRIPNERPS
ncbi:MAG: hypothetical protein ACLQVX_03480 [Limisphaerales bacterium]